MKQYFIVEESPYNQGKYLIYPVHENFFLSYTTGSFDIICARLLGLSYPQYLRFCRDVLDAEVIGKNELYPTVYFSTYDKAKAFCDLLNARADLIVWNRNHPNWKEHQAELKEKMRREKIDVSKFGFIEEV